MTFATLRALQAIIGEAIDEIHALYASESRPHLASPSPPSSPSSSSSSPPPSPPKQHRSPTPPPLSLSNNSLSSASHYSSSNTPTPSDHYAPIDFPDLDLPGDLSSPAEQLTSRPDVANAISRIVAAASQLAVVVRSPFLTICDATMIVRPVLSSFARYNFSKSTTSLHAYAFSRHLTSQSSLAPLGLQVYLS